MTTYPPQKLRSVTRLHQVSSFLLIKDLTLLKQPWLKIAFIHRDILRFKTQEHFHASLNSGTIDAISIAFMAHLIQNGSEKVVFDWGLDDMFVE